jgi:hypothetical protein
MPIDMNKIASALYAKKKEAIKKSDNFFETWFSEEIEPKIIADIEKGKKVFFDTKVLECPKDLSAIEDIFEKLAVIFVFMKGYTLRVTRYEGDYGHPCDTGPYTEWAIC